MFFRYVFAFSFFLIFSLPVFSADNWSNGTIDINFAHESEVGGFASNQAYDVNVVSDYGPTGKLFGIFDLNIGVFFPDPVSAPVCNNNGVQDGAETGVDCGNNICPACAPSPGGGEGPAPSAATAQSGGGGGGGGGGGPRVNVKDITLAPLEKGVPSTISFLVSNGAPITLTLLTLTEIRKDGALEYSYEQEVPAVFSGRAVKVTLAKQWTPQSDGQRTIDVTLFSFDKSKKYDVGERIFSVGATSTSELLVEEFQKEMSVNLGEASFFGIKIKNSSALDAKSMKLMLEGIPAEWYSVEQEKQDLAPFDSMYFILKVSVPVDAQKKRYPVSLRAASDRSFVDFAGSLAVTEPADNGIIFKDVGVESVTVKEKGKIKAVIFNSTKDDETVVVSLSTPPGWVVAQNGIEVFIKSGEEKEVEFSFVAPDSSGVENVALVVKKKTSGGAFEGDSVTKKFFVMVKPEVSDGNSVVLSLQQGDLLWIGGAVVLMLAGLAGAAYYFRDRLIFIPGRKFK